MSNDERNQVVGETMDRIRAVMDAGPTLENLEQGKAHLIALAGRTDLFNFDAFPLPEDENVPFDTVTSCS